MEYVFSSLSNIKIGIKTNLWIDFLCSHILLLQQYYLIYLLVYQLGEGYCFNGNCPTLANQCEHIWGYGGTAADRQCYDQFNTKGSISGHCGMDAQGKYMTCAPEWVDFKFVYRHLYYICRFQQERSLRYTSVQGWRASAVCRGHGSIKFTDDYIN